MITQNKNHDDKKKKGGLKFFLLFLFTFSSNLTNKHTETK